MSRTSKPPGKELNGDVYLSTQSKKIENMKNAYDGAAISFVVPEYHDYVDFLTARANMLAREKNVIHVKPIEKEDESLLDLGSNKPVGYYSMWSGGIKTHPGSRKRYIV